MKQSKFMVIFSDGTYPGYAVYETAFTVEEAIILAKAERIKSGLDYTVNEVREI